MKKKRETDKKGKGSAHFDPESTACGTRNDRERGDDAIEATVDDALELVGQDGVPFAGRA